MTRLDYDAFMGLREGRHNGAAGDTLAESEQPTMIERIEYAAQARWPFLVAAFATVVAAVVL